MMETCKICGKERKPIIFNSTTISMSEDMERRESEICIDCWNKGHR